MTDPVTAELLHDVPAAFVGAWLFAVGLVLGSFLNVVIHRVPRGLSVVRPRSTCPACGRMIRWHENVPVLSWLALGRRCAGCRAPISWRYPAVELLFALEVLAAWRVFGPTLALAIAVPFLFVVTALVFTDLEHFLLPDALTLPGVFAGLALSFVSPLTTPEDALLGVLASVLVVEGLNLAFKIVRGRDGFGAGDTKMLMLVGAFLGWRMALFTMMAASVAGAVVGVAALVWRSRRAEPEADADAEPAADGEPAPRRSALAELVPTRPEELLAPLLAFALLLAYFAVPEEGASRRFADPRAALAGLLAGIVLMKLHDAWNARGGRAPSPVPRGTELWALAGAVAGLPPTPWSALVAVALAALCVAARAPLARALAPPAPAGAAPPAGADDQPVPPGALPLGVFLGAGAVVALLFGEAVIEWYLEAVLGLAP